MFLWLRHRNSAPLRGNQQPSQAKDKKTKTGQAKTRMASYHCAVKVGGKGHAAAHAEYIAREGKYSGFARYEDLEATSYGNMPAWSEHNPSHFWQAADEHERANGATYREIEVALPRELNTEQRRDLVEDFIKKEIGENHAYQWAIHTPKAALEKGEQPHAHIMYSERTNDGIARDTEQYFKRYNAKAPERGGCRKDSAGTEERLQATRQRWADIQNQHLERHGHDTSVDHRSLKQQGIEREPEKHLGGVGVRKLSDHDISALLERRAAEGEHERSQKEVSVIDLSGDLEKAINERDNRHELHLQAERQRRETEQRLQVERARQERARRLQAEQERQEAERHAFANLWAKFEGIEALPMPEQVRLYDLGLDVLTKEAERQKTELIKGDQADYTQAYQVSEAAKVAVSSLKPGLFDIFHKTYDAEFDRLEKNHETAYDKTVEIWNRLERSKEISPHREALQSMRSEEPDLCQRVADYKERLKNPVHKKLDAEQLRKLQEARGEQWLERQSKSQRPPPQTLNKGKRRGR